MTPASIKAAAAEAKRFLQRVKEWEAEQGTYEGHGGFRFSISTPKQSGAVRRASMDLTRALSAMRKP